MIRTLLAANLLLLTTLSAAPAHAAAAFNSLTCRSFDYFQLGGDRKTLEVKAVRQADGRSFLITVSRTFDLLQPNHIDYVERNRYVETTMADLNCVQATGSVDPKVITCTSADANSYFNLSRLERTLIASEHSSTPEKVFSTVSYDAAVYGQRSDEYKDFAAKDCVLN